MGAQRLGRVEVACQFGLGQGGVDFVVADLMHQNRGPALAAFELGDQMVQALAGYCRNGAATERADGVGGVGHLILGSVAGMRMGVSRKKARGV